MTGNRGVTMNRHSLFPILALASTASVASAQVPRNPQPCDDRGGTYPCNYQIQELQLQPSPGVFKFQARVSQAKLPVGEGNFARVIVKVVRGTTTLCQEEFSDVRVQSSVINLELGRGMTCELDQVIAENPDLNFQLCLGGEANCLRPIQLGSTPYAIKSTFARTAQEAHLANVAGQSNYTHRATADRDLFLSKELGFGYFDFSTPPTKGSLYMSEQSFSPFASGGYIQWTPLSETDPTLHICARDDLTDEPRLLERLVLAANATNVMGSLNVASGGIHVTGASDVTGTTTVRGVLKVDPPASGANGLQVTGPTTLNGNTNITGAVVVAPPPSAPATSNTLTVNGNSDFGVLTVRQLIVTSDFTNRGTNTITGATNLGGVSGNFNVGGDLSVNGSGTFNGALAVTNGISFRNSGSGAGGQVLTHGSGNQLFINPNNVLGGGTTVQSALSVTGVLAATGEARLVGGAEVSGLLKVKVNGATPASVAFVNGSNVFTAFKYSETPARILEINPGTPNASMDQVKITGPVLMTSSVAGQAFTGTTFTGTAFTGESFRGRRQATQTLPSEGPFFFKNDSAAAGSHASVGVRVTNGGGNAFVSLDVEGVSGWSIGEDNADEKLKIRQDWNFVTNDRLIMSNDGTLELPGKVTFGGQREVRFAQNAGDENNAGVIGYRRFDPGALDIVGAGPASPGNTRRVRIWDTLYVPNIERPCPANMTAYDTGGQRLCVGKYVNPANGDLTWYQAVDQCGANFSGATLCRFDELFRACRAGATFPFAYWAGDRTADDEALFVNRNPEMNRDNCDAADGVRGVYVNPRDMRGAACCVTYH